MRLFARNRNQTQMGLRQKILLAPHSQSEERLGMELVLGPHVPLATPSFALFSGFASSSGLCGFIPFQVHGPRDKKSFSCKSCQKKKIPEKISDWPALGHMSFSGPVSGQGNGMLRLVQTESRAAFMGNRAKICYQEKKFLGEYFGQLKKICF